jgi:hypothetical protein
MNLREMNLAVFRGEPIPHPLFQPRFEPWFDWQNKFGTMPAKLRGINVRDAYDRIGASMRYVDYYTKQPHPLKARWADDVKNSEDRTPQQVRYRYDTPHGTLLETHEFTVDKTWRTVEFAAKSADDLPALRWLVARRRFDFDAAAYSVGDAFIGHRGVGQFWVPKSPYMAVAQQWMKYEDFVYALMDAPQAMEDVFAAIDDSQDELYEQIIGSGVARIINFGENLAMAYFSLEYFDKYILPWYQKRSGQLRRSGIFTHVHIDGSYRPLLPYIRHMPFDGIEALTPKPQGDVTLDEMIDNMGDKVLLDGIPAVLFLRHHPLDQLQACTETIVKRLHPRLVLGISDELPEGGDEESFDRMAWVAQYCKTYRA